MKRSDFIRSAFDLGMCSCAGAFLAGTTVPAEPTTDTEVSELNRKLDFVRKRFATLVAILKENLDESTRQKIFQSLGRACAKEFSHLTEKFKGNLEGFLKEIQKQWAEKAEYEAESGRIRVVDRSSTCTCAFVNKQLTPPDFCNCTLGWQKETYEAILGRPVEAELEESILRGGKRCIFRIQIAGTAT